MAVKDSELVIVNGKMYHVRISPEQLAKQVFVCGDPARADTIAAHFDTIEHKAHNREYVIRTGTYKDMPVTVIATGIGTDNNEIALIEAFGLNEFNLKTREKKNLKDIQPLTIIRIGTCGGVQPENECGDLAISSYGLGLDNTGLYYQCPAQDDTSLKIEEEAYRIMTDATPKGYRFKGKIHPYCAKASDLVVNALQKHAKTKSATGITATASGFFAPQGREIPGLDITIPRLQELLATLNVDNHKIINFEMESSLLFHLASKMGYHAGTICPIIANRPKGTFISDYSKAVEKAIETALEAMVDVNKKLSAQQP